MAIIGDFVSGQSNVSYTRMRALLAESGGGLQEGVVGATDLKGSQRAAGANMSVDVAAGAAWIAVDTGTRNGISHAFSDAVANLSVAAAHATLPRIDQVTLRYNDTAVPTGSGNVPTLQVITGTATSGATIDNRLGAAALPNDSVRLFDIFVGPAVGSIVTANIRDRRPWARGAYNRISRTSANYTTASAIYAEVDATNLNPRIECSGVPVHVGVRGGFFHSVAGLVTIVPSIDGAVVEGASSPTNQFYESNASQTLHFETTWETVPAAGSHVFGIRFAVVTAGTLTLQASAGNPLLFTVEEIVRPVASNT